MAEPVGHTNGNIPDRVTLDAEHVATAFTPRELDAVKAHFGRAFTKVMADEDTDEKFTVLAWLKLRRMDFEVSLDQMLDVVIELDASAVMDPTSGVRPTLSPPSAAIGE